MKQLQLTLPMFNYFSSGRKQRRDFQSLAVRELLDSSLQKHFPQSIDVSWSFNKSETLF